MNYELDRKLTTKEHEEHEEKHKWIPDDCDAWMRLSETFFLLPFFVSFVFLRGENFG